MPPYKGDDARNLVDTGDLVSGESGDFRVDRDALGVGDRPCSLGEIDVDVKSALINLGYDERAAEAAVAEAKRQAGSANFENLLRATLAALSAPQKR